MRKYVVVLAVALGTSGFIVQDAAAVTIKHLSQKVSAARLKQACLEVGGSYINSGDHRSCSNLDNGINVNCDAKGHCTGVFPRQQPPSPKGSGTVVPLASAKQSQTGSGPSGPTGSKLR